MDQPDSVSPHSTTGELGGLMSPTVNSWRMADLDLREKKNWEENARSGQENT